MRHYFAGDIRPPPYLGRRHLLRGVLKWMLFDMSASSRANGDVAIAMRAQVQGRTPCARGVPSLPLSTCVLAVESPPACRSRAKQEHQHGRAAQCCLKVGPTSSTPAQPLSNIGPIYIVCWRRSRLLQQKPFRTQKYKFMHPQVEPNITDCCK